MSEKVRSQFPNSLTDLVLEYEGRLRIGNNPDALFLQFLIFNYGVIQSNQFQEELDISLHNLAELLSLLVSERLIAFRSFGNVGAWIVSPRGRDFLRFVNAIDPNHEHSIGQDIVHNITAKRLGKTLLSESNIDTLYSYLRDIDADKQELFARFVFSHAVTNTDVTIFFKFPGPRDADDASLLEITRIAGGAVHPILWQEYVVYDEHTLYNLTGLPLKDEPAKSINKSGDIGSQSKLRIRLDSYDHIILDRSAQEIIDTARRTEAIVHGIIRLPTRKETFTVLRGPHIDKKSREQFEIRTHKRLIEIISPNKSTVDALSKLVVPAGVDVRIKTKVTSN
jgi:small subunit ribosomal protein S10